MPENDKKDLLQGLNQRLMSAYAAELICLAVRFYEGSHWYAARRQGLHKDLDHLLKGDSNA